MDGLGGRQYGIQEPKEGYMPADPEDIDFAVIPCMSCDAEGYRLGHGGGIMTAICQAQPSWQRWYAAKG